MIVHILVGWIFWQRVRIKYKINYNKVLIVLTDENHELDKQVIIHLSDYLERKHVKSAIILCKDDCMMEWVSMVEYMKSVKVYSWPITNMEKLYSYYCFIKFFDNIVFTYIDKPSDNMLGTYLRETDVNEEDAACLALYHLRSVPKARR